MKKFPKKQAIFFIVVAGVVLGCVFVFLVIFSDVLPVFANPADYYKINAGAAAMVNEHGVCKVVTNGCSLAIFVPTKTADEWTDFRTYKPSCVTLTGPCLIIYAAGTINGDLEGRSGADTICTSYFPSGLSGSKKHAFISVTDTDAIKDMPDNYSYGASLPIYGYQATGNYTRIANNWLDMRDGSIQNSMVTVLGIGVDYWTGSQGEGSVHGYTCSGWMDSISESYGRRGKREATDGTWMSIDDANCSANQYLLCAAELD